MVKNIVKKEIEEAIKNPLLNPRGVHQKVSNAVFSNMRLSNSLAFIPTSNSMAKSIQYQRCKSASLPPISTDWEFEIPDEFKVTADGLDFLIGDSEIPGRSGRVLSFCG